MKIATCHFNRIGMCRTGKRRSNGRPTSVCRRRLRTVVASLALQSPGLSWCPGLGRLLASAALLRMAPGSGTDCQRSSEHQNCRWLHWSASSRPTCSSTRQLWLQLWVSCTVVRHCCTASSASTTDVQTRLDAHRRGRTKLRWHMALKCALLWSACLVYLCVSCSEFHELWQVTQYVDANAGRNSLLSIS